LGIIFLVEIDGHDLKSALQSLKTLLEPFPQLPLCSNYRVSWLT
jgi:hypothetical protein